MLIYLYTHSKQAINVKQKQRKKILFKNSSSQIAYTDSIYLFRETMVNIYIKIIILPNLIMYRTGNRI